MESKALLFLVTGSQGAGKTTFCAVLAQAARAAGWRVTGLLSRGVFDGTQRAAIEVEDLSSGERRTLAHRSDQPTPGSKHWRFAEDGLAWGDTVLRRSMPCDFLVIDELGPLEFTQNRGWRSAFDIVAGRQYAIAVVVVRAEFLPEALLRWSEAEIVEIDTPEDVERKAAVLIQDLFD